MKTKCIWTACMAAFAVCITLRVNAADNLGDGYISKVTSDTNCVFNDTNGGGNQFWDIQAGGTYTATISGVDDAANGGLDPTMSVIVHNTGGGNICTTATQTGTQGEYTFSITLTTQCNTMPIEYGTLSCNPKSQACMPVAGCQGFGMFAQDFNGTGAGGNEAHLRTTIFDASCGKVSDDNLCQGGPTPTPTPTGKITVCKYFDKNANGFQDTGEPNLVGWPFCINPLDGGTPALVTQFTGSGGCVTWSNLTTPGDYVVTEANPNETNWFHSDKGTQSPSDIMLASGGTDTRSFGNFCLVPSGGLTLGFWSNKNGNKLITSDGATTGTGKTLKTDVVTLLNACSLRNANGTVHTFLSGNTGYADFRTWLLSATATNMAYMLSAQLAALKLDVYFGFVNGGDFDLCSHMTIGGAGSLISTACDQLGMDGNTVAGNPTRVAQEMLKNCIDAINNGGNVIPSDPSRCPYTFPTPPAPCP